MRDDLVIAWLLHDVVEDTSTMLDEVRRRFGDAVAGLVRAASKNDDAMEVAGERTTRLGVAMDLRLALEEVAAG